MRGLKVLVVEDDVALRTFYELALLEHGHAVNAVSNGEEALTAVSPDVDVLITDLMMPVMNGEELITELRSRPEYRELPVLVVTAHPGDLDPAVRDDRTAVLRKPFELDDFVKRVDAAARHARPVN